MIISLCSWPGTHCDQPPPHTPTPHLPCLPPMSPRNPSFLQLLCLGVSPHNKPLMQRPGSNKGLRSRWSHGQQRDTGNSSQRHRANKTYSSHHWRRCGERGPFHSSTAVVVQSVQSAEVKKLETSYLLTVHWWMNRRQNQHMHTMKYYPAIKINQ